MASGLKTTKNNHFEATYEQPWGGVASDAYKTDIAPNQFESCNGLNIKDGLLCAISWDTAPLITDAVATATIVQLIFNIGVNLYVATPGNIYKYVIGTGFVLDQTDVTMSSCDCVQVIAGIAYIFSYTAGASFVYTPGVSLTTGSTFVGGLFCCVVDQYLLTANTNQPTDTPAIKPNRVNWSSPDGFTTWDPSVDRSSGFNTLADVSDIISGIFAVGNIAFVLRTQGLTQLTPTGVGIQPFDFTSYWASTFGIGCTFPQSFAQYGNIAIWANDTNIYAFNGASPQAITGSARKAIYKDLTALTNNNTVYPTPGTSFVLGTIASQTASTPDAVNFSTPDLEYTLAIVSLIKIGSLGQIQSIFWTYKMTTQQWTRSVHLGPSFTYANFISMSAILSGVYLPLTLANGLTIFKTIPTLVVNSNVGVTGTTVFLSKYQADLGLPISTPNSPPAFSVSFRAEEIQIRRQPQLRGVVIEATGQLAVNTNLNITVHNETESVQFTDINFVGTVLKAYLSNGVFTGERPQITISSGSFDGVIVKVLGYGTYADGELP